MGSRRRAYGLVVAGIALALLAGCSGTDPRRGLSDDEIAWVAKYGRWRDQFALQMYREWRARDVVLLQGGQRRYREATRSIRSCGDQLHDALSPHSEAETECAAVQHNEAVARRLGASEAFAQQLARFYWTDLYPQLPTQYRAPGCAPGGSLDLHPETQSWPTD